MPSRHYIPYNFYEHNDDFSRSIREILDATYGRAYTQEYTQQSEQVRQSVGANYAHGSVADTHPNGLGIQPLTREEAYDLYRPNTMAYCKYEPHQYEESSPAVIKKFRAIKDTPPDSEEWKALTILLNTELSIKMQGFELLIDGHVLVARIHEYTQTKRLYLKNKCKLYFSSPDITYWILEKNFNKLREVNGIKWCPINKIWGSTISFKNTYYKEANKTKVKQAFWNPKVITACSICTKIWLKECIKGTEYASEVCPDCINIKPTNKKIPENEAMLRYHGHKGIWTFIPQRLGNDSTAMPMGLEIEMANNPATKHKPITNCWHVLQEQEQHNTDWNNIYFETDSSIGPSGVELISNPMTLEYHRHYWPIMLKSLRKRFVGWDTHKLNHYPHGIHITFNRLHFSDLHLARLKIFSEYDKNSEFMDIISQRNYIYGLDEGNKICNGSKKISGYMQIDGGKILNSSKYRAVHIKGKLIEVRMFASTLNTTSFFKNLEFIDAFRNWSMETRFDPEYTAFLSWLGTGTYHSRRYHHLIKYLNQDVFYIKDKDAQVLRVPNTIKKYVKPMKEIPIKYRKPEDNTTEQFECA